MVRSLIFRLLAVLLFAYTGFTDNAALAHLTPNTTVEIDARRDDILITITIPEGEWAYAYGSSTVRPADIASRISLISNTGTPWVLRNVQVKHAVSYGTPDLLATLIASPPAGASARQFKLQYSGVIERVASHSVLVSLRSDFSGGVLAGHSRLLGALQAERRILPLDLGDASRWNGFYATFALGVEHIVEGYDHLLFLFALLLPAALLAKGGRWIEAVAPRVAIGRLIGIITAFTIGHSLTLIGGAWFGWSLPVQPVEVGIALSVLVSALHAARPIFAGKEALVAAGFGLIHGLAFATIIGQFTLPATERATAILGFNLGIEAVQLVIATLLLPVLVWVSRQNWYQSVRMVLATATGLMALFWVWERI